MDPLANQRQQRALAEEILALHASKPDIDHAARHGSVARAEEIINGVNEEIVALAVKLAELARVTDNQATTVVLPSEGELITRMVTSVQKQYDRLGWNMHVDACQNVLDGIHHGSYRQHLTHEEYVATGCDDSPWEGGPAA